MNLSHSWRALPCPALACSLSSPFFLVGPAIWCSTLLAPVSCPSAPPMNGCLWTETHVPDHLHAPQLCLFILNLYLGPGLHPLPGVWSPWKPVISGLSHQQLSYPDTGTGADVSSVLHVHLLFPGGLDDKHIPSHSVQAKNSRSSVSSPVHPEYVASGRMFSVPGDKS